ncbi:dihydropteroate synthase [Candidatus Halobonum tyrrellensis]|uniref:Probable bifunctional folylpolyglutamate synthase/dihydropteroate synthase n=1 Tax=Candidatus Halobonum tyrrellensis G22 TaxID=1324957 RepID=V4HI02_9EURY|nr:dihydropteroate synthase [Candidatus Halobonum tyrrellensis]ESP89378.1 dihydropteroate synthase [Candidatus Halobonum tyrrellensis G22]
MEYYEAANFLFGLRRFQVDPGTESVRDLLAHLGDPHEGTEFVQVAGSNGKGSVARMLESTLRADGRTVGLYTSPHFEDLRERIRVDGRMIPERAVTAFVEEAKPWLVERAADGEPLTFFEVVTAMGVWRFGRADVDVAVLEVGMGGELDATSVVDPVAACVTTVSLEHTAVLGDTVEEIATTKAKVAPADAPLVTATTGAALDTVREVAGEVVTVGGPGDGADVTAEYGGAVTHQESRVSLAGDDWRVETRLPLLGAYQATNAGVAAALARQVGVDDAALARGLRSAHWPGRFEVIETEPFVVLDGAHNPDACATLAAALDELDFDSLHLVFGAMHDKDHDEMAAALPDPETVRTCAPATDRAEDPEVLARVFERATDADVRPNPSVPDALSAARDAAGADDCVLLAGSLFCVAEARTAWTRTATPKAVDSPERAADVLRGANAPPDAVDRAREEAVHRVVETRVTERQAAVLERRMPAVGGDCVTSGLDGGGELHEVVLTGTLGAFRRLVADLDGASAGGTAGPNGAGGLSDVADRVRRAAGLDAGPPGRGYPWEEGTAVMGVLNVTPDSFHDGGEFFDREDALARAERLVEAGVDIVDVGGESTRPGAEEVAVEDEIARIVPVIEAIAGVDALVSVDTRKAEVAAAALDAGADLLNDVTGLEDPEMRFLAAERDVPVIVMHSIDAPVDPDTRVEYDDVVGDVIDQLRERVLLAEKAGVPREHVVVDPGVGFGKSKRENFEMLGRLGEFDALGCPVLFGHSHKSMFELVGGEGGDAGPETVAATALAAANGADIVRVHDAAENVRAVRVAAAAADPEGFDPPGTGEDE